MPFWETLLGSAVGPLLGGIFGSDASEDAANAQVRAGQEANATQMAMFNQNRADMAPWRDAGQTALAQLMQGMGPEGQFMQRFGMDDFQADPGYQFRMAEGLKALERSGLRSGGIDGGPMLKNFMRFGQDLGSQEYGNAYNRYNQDMSNMYNRLAGVSGTGQTTAQQIGTMGANVANQIGQTQQGIGNARASGYMGSANALSNALGQGYNQWQGNRMFDLYNNYLQRPTQMAASPGNDFQYGLTYGMDY